MNGKTQSPVQSNPYKVSRILKVQSNFSLVHKICKLLV